MNCLVEIVRKKTFRDQHGEHLRHDIADIGMPPVPGVRYSPLYRFEGDLTADEITAVASRLLVDPVTDEFRIQEPETAQRPQRGIAVEIWLKPGVTDTVAGSVAKAVKDLGIQKMFKVATGQKFVFQGKISPKAVRQIAERLLVNRLIQEYKIR